MLKFSIDEDNLYEACEVYSVRADAVQIQSFILLFYGGQLCVTLVSGSPSA